jgi:hypothetical protein
MDRFRRRDARWGCRTVARGCWSTRSTDSSKRPSSRKHGGSAGGGAELTPFGHHVIEQYRAIEKKAHNAVAGELAALAAATARSDG